MAAITALRLVLGRRVETVTSEAPAHALPSGAGVSGKADENRWTVRVNGAVAGPTMEGAQ
jgi:hypothetical protein